MFGLLASISACHGPVSAPPSDSSVYAPATSDYGKVHAAWVYAGHGDLRAKAGYKLVAADIELPPAEFDLDDIDIFDAKTGENFGSDPLLYPLTPSGQLVGDDDPEVAGRHDYRGWFIWQVPERVTVVNFGYWGEMLYTSAVPLAETGPVVPDQAVKVTAIARRNAPSGEYQPYIALLEATNWFRVDEPSRYTLHSSAGRESTYCDCDRWIEVDWSGAVLEQPIQERPLVVPTRKFLVEYWCPLGVEPKQLDLFGTRFPLPGFANLPLPTHTVEALDRGTAKQYPLHRLDASE
ncbi:MAG TPA: hypothetical protein VKM72_15255 [Thermoanaerobaculia bacterium]|nr:hypothetical protein [Thermoanaerobaculia bacterium]